MIAERYTDYMYNLTEKVLKEIGPRGSCSEEEKRLGRLFAGEIEPACDKVETETFTCNPNAFLGVIPFIVAVILAGIVLYFFLPPLSLALGIISFTALALEIIRYRESFDPLFPEKTGENIVGFVKPRGEVKKRVYVSAHFDSAYEFNLFRWFKVAGPYFIFAGILAVLLLVGFSLARTIAEPVGLPRATAFKILGYILIGLSPFAVLFAFFHTYRVVPGATDNLAAVTVVAALGRYLQDAREKGEFFPENTEVVLLGTSSEEAGLRGAKRYAARHLEECKSRPTYAIFLDGISDERRFTIFGRELFMGAKADPYLVETAMSVAQENGFNPKVGVLPFGATDASAFCRAGIPAMNLCLTDNTKLVPYYHTRYDTIEYVRPQALTVTLQTVIDMLKRIDARQSDAGGATPRSTA